MIPVLGAIGCALVATVAFTLYFKSSDNFLDRALGWALIGWLFVIVTLVFAFGGLIAGMSIHFNRVTCQNFGEVNGRETRFERLSYFDMGTCFVKAADGRWVTSVAYIHEEANR